MAAVPGATVSLTTALTRMAARGVGGMLFQFGNRQSGGRQNPVQAGLVPLCQKCIIGCNAPGQFEDHLAVGPRLAQRCYGRLGENDVVAGIEPQFAAFE